MHTYPKLIGTGLNIQKCQMIKNSFEIIFQFNIHLIRSNDCNSMDNLWLCNIEIVGKQYRSHMFNEANKTFLILLHLLANLCLLHPWQSIITTWIIRKNIPYGSHLIYGSPLEKKEMCSFLEVLSRKLNQYTSSIMDDAAGEWIKRKTEEKKNLAKW